MAEPNYLLGKGERLVQDVQIPQAGKDKDLPTDFDTAQKRMAPRIKAVSQQLDQLPGEACPNDEGVAAITLHPGQVAKSYYPKALLGNLGLRAVGSHSVVSVVDGENAPTTELYVAARRDVFRRIASGIDGWTDSVAWADDLRRISDFRLVPIEQRIKPIHSDNSIVLCEVVLHGAGDSDTAQTVIEAFATFAEKRLNASVDTSRRIDAGTLSFLAVEIPRDKLNDIAQFGFLRTVRLMPRLRQLEPESEQEFSYKPFECTIAPTQVLERNISVAVFDGGMPSVPALQHCVTVHNDIEGLGDPDDDFVQHGLSVTSALLFGPMRENEPTIQPFAHIHHYRVLDSDTRQDSAHELYTVLDRITGILESKHFDFVNISLGPCVPVDDDDVHPWTIRLDQLTSNGTTLITSAVGNSGRSPAMDQLNRIQPPSDGVNLLAVGACDSDGLMWKRAEYSSVGKGRSPGVVKPDGVAFGGCPEEPFWVVDSHDHGITYPTNGTSVAAPYALRAAVGVKAALGGDVLPLAAKALLIHSCSNDSKLDISEVGYGKFCTDIEELITCDSRSVHVIYQDVLEPKRWVQAAIPMLPVEEMNGFVSIRATMCFATEVDPEHPGLYTQSGLDIVFRRDKYNIKPEKSTAVTTSFFRSIDGVEEADLRTDWHKWETVRCAGERFQARTLKDPVLDIHYNPRKGGKDSGGARSIPYAMVISVRAETVSDFYSKVAARYHATLAALKPRIRLPSNRV